MSFHLLNPPETREEFEVLLMEILSAADALGFTIEAANFANAWLSGTKIIAERDADGVIVSLGFMVHGKKWFDASQSATILRMDGNTKGIVDYAKSIATILNVRKLYYETGQYTENEDGSIDSIVRMEIVNG